MGTSSTALFSDDIACDVRDEFVEQLSIGVSPADATQSIVRSWSVAINDVDDGPVFWMALAATQWKYGCLVHGIQSKAIEIIDRGLDLQRWEGAALGRRRAVLSSLKDKLLSPQPALRRPPRRKQIVVQSTKVLSPDERALATAYELGKSPNPDGPRMQVLIEMEASGSRGGGGVFVADCEYTEVVLKWLDSETLQISYPNSAAVTAKQPSLFYYGRTISIAYEARSV